MSIPRSTWRVVRDDKPDSINLRVASLLVFSSLGGRLEGGFSITSTMLTLSASLRLRRDSVEFMLSDCEFDGDMTNNDELG